MVPLLSLLVGLVLRLTVFIDSPEHHGEVVSVLEHGVLAQENGTPFLL